MRFPLYLGLRSPRRSPARSPAGLSGSRRVGAARLRFALLGAVLAAWGLGATLPVRADVVHLTNGRTLQGEVVAGAEENGSLTLVTAFGTLELPASMVRRVERSTSLREAVARARARIDPQDADALLDLALWCRREGAETLARELLEEVLTLAPGHSGAHRALGHVEEGGRWMTETEARRARGEVRFQGRWMPREEAERLAAAEALRAEVRREVRRLADQRSRREAQAAGRAAASAYEAGFVAGYGAVPHAPGGSAYEGGVVYGIPVYAPLGYGGPPVYVPPGAGPPGYGPPKHGPGSGPHGKPGKPGMRGPEGRGTGAGSPPRSGTDPGRSHRGSKAGVAAAPRLPSGGS